MREIKRPDLACARRCGCFAIKTLLHKTAETCSQSYEACTDVQTIHNGNSAVTVMEARTRKSTAKQYFEKHAYPNNQVSMLHADRTAVRGVIELWPQARLQSCMHACMHVCLCKCMCICVFVHVCVLM
jgi:hypothetical protein